LAGPFSRAIPLRQRFGVTGNVIDVQPAYNGGLLFGSHHNFRLGFEPVLVGEITYWQTVRLQGDRPVESWTRLAAAAATWPGSFWIIGNEPDVEWQDNVTPERYADLYHDLYLFIKGSDPTARLVVGNVSQSTPLRRAYLDRVLAAYEQANGQPMPVDIWGVHGYILREEANSWGVGIPPGMTAELARLYEIPDHGNLAIFEQNLVDFRAWMAERGYADRPLALTEYGILFPPDYGYPPEVIAAYLTDTFDFLLSAANETGYVPDGNRLFQWWFWYSLTDDEQFPSSNLYDRPTSQLTLIGQAYANYARRFLSGQ
jgi:hypothetical protein